MGLNPGANVHLRRADLRSGGLAAFDIVMANLTGGILIQAAPRLHDLTAPSGRLILSGFLKPEEAEVLDAFGGYAVEHRAEEDEWLCVTLGRP
jgi:ribosomal protein L11 methylase PrmA